MDIRGGFRRLSRLMIIALSLNLLIAAQSPRGVSGLRSYLPSGQDAGEWTMDGEPQEYTGEDLFLYIDGGAEIYREYGFAEVLVQEYRGPKGKRLSLEIFRMTSPEAAFGMYTFKRSPKGTPFEGGAEGQLEDYYLNLWKGDFLVTVAGHDDSPATRRGLPQLARAVAKKIPGPSNPAPLVKRIPQPTLIKSSVRYFRGYLGFMNFYASLGRQAFVFDEGVRADYSSGASLFILKYSSGESLRRGFAGIEKSLRDDPGSSGFTSGRGLSFQVIDDKGKLLSLQVVDQFLLLCIEDRTLGTNAPELFGKVRKGR